MTLASHPSHSVVFEASTTNLQSITASGSVTLGDDDDDTVTVYGRLKVVNDDDKTVFGVDPQTGDLSVEGSLEVVHDSKFDGSAVIGSDGERVVVVPETTFWGDTTAYGTLNVTEDAHFTSLWGSNIFLSESLRMQNQAGESTFEVDANTGDVFSAGSLYVSGYASYTANVSLGLEPADTILFHGDVAIDGRVLAETDAAVAGDAHVEGGASVLGDLDLAGDLSVLESTTVAEDVVLHGGLLLQGISRGGKVPA